MQRLLRVCAGCGVFLALCGVARAGDGFVDFALTFDGPGELSGAAGAALSAEYTVVLTQGSVVEPGVGAQGWSLSIATTGALSLTGITTDGTDASMNGGLQNGGFEKTEVAGGVSERDCEGLTGAVSAVVLSFTMPITLNPDAPSPIARVTVGATAPEAGSCVEGTVDALNGCRGSGQPVDNNVTYGGNTVVPTSEGRTVQICGVEIVACPLDQPGLQIVIQGDNPAGDGGHQVVGDRFAGILTAVGAEDPALVERFVGPGERGSATLYGAISSNLEEGGVQGWSLSAAVGGDVNLTAVTLAGTAGANTPDGLANGGFEKTETVDADFNSQGQGAVSAVVLSFTMPITLAPVGTATVLCFDIESAVDQPEGEDGLVTGSLSWKDGLKGSGQPVQNVATVNGNTVNFLCCQNATIAFRTVTDARNDFQRGNANDDNKVDIADPIYVVNYLFRSGPAPACDDAADANDDGNVDVTDATFLVDYLFRGSSAPSAPFPGCGKDGGDEGEDDDGLGCAVDGFSCP